MPRRMIIALLAGIIAGVFDRQARAQDVTTGIDLEPDDELVFETLAICGGGGDVYVEFTKEEPKPCPPGAIRPMSAGFQSIIVAVDGKRYRITAADIERELAEFRV